MFPAFSKIWLINILMAAFVVFFGIKSFDIWSKGDETIQEIQTGNSSVEFLPGKGLIERALPPESAYGIVAEKNLFSANRSEFIPEKPKPEPGLGLKSVPGPKPGPEPPKISEKKIFLYGVVMTGDRKKALISNPETGPMTGRTPARDKWVEVGDTAGNYSVTEIRKDRLILADGTGKREILLYDKNKPARQMTVMEKSAGPTVVTIGPAAAAATVPKTVSTEPAAAAAAAPTTVSTEPAAAAATTSAKEPPKPGTAAGKGPEGEYKTINTPFGPVKRRTQ